MFEHNFSFNASIFMTIYIVDSPWRLHNYEWSHLELCSQQKKVQNN